MPTGNLAQQQTEDARAIERVRAGDRATVTAVMQLHNQALWRIARGILRSESEAEDAVQDAYVSAFTHLDDFRGESTLYTWLARITINEALRRLRRRQPTVDIASLAETTPADHPHPLMPATIVNPEHIAARREISRLVEQAIDALNPAFRVVFVMRVIEEMSIDETSARLGIPSGTVKTRLHRAQRELRRTLGTQFAGAFDGVFPFAGARCQRLQQAVLARLALPGGHPGVSKNPATATPQTNAAPRDFLA